MSTDNLASSIAQKCNTSNITSKESLIVVKLGKNELQIRICRNYRKCFYFFKFESDIPMIPIDQANVINNLFSVLSQSLSIANQNDK